MGSADRRRSRLVAPFVLAASALAVLARDARAQAQQQQELSPPVPSFSQYFGTSVAAEGDVIVVGAPNDASGPAPGGGGAVVYRRDATTGRYAFEAHLYAGDPEGGSNFGANVAVDGDLVVVGCPQHDWSGFTDGGVAYVFRRTSGVWSQEQKLGASVSGSNWKFGNAVAVDGDRIVVGVPNADTTRGTATGEAIVFRYVGGATPWTEEQALIDPDGAHADVAGADVAISGTTIAVGSSLATEVATQSGSVGIWTRSGTTWTQVQELLPTATTNYTQFGASLALRGSQLLVGAPNEEYSPSIPYCGAAYLFAFTAGSWTLDRHFVPPSPATVIGYGVDVAVDGDLVAIGQPYYDGFAGDAGGAWMYRRRNARQPWVEDQLLTRSSAGLFDNLGIGVALNATDLALGARYCDAYGSDQGAVDVYSADECALSFAPSAPAPGAQLVLKAARGDPGDFFMIVIHDVSGVPLFLPLLNASFASDHGWSLTTTAPNPAFGLHLGMRVWKISPTGKAVYSDLAYVDV